MSFLKLRPSAWNLVRAARKIALCRIYTFINYLEAFLSAVELGRRCRFHGRTSFHKSHAASIKIGDLCVFRSAPRSNLVGINRPCILSAHGAATLTIGTGCGLSGTVIGCFLKVTLGENVRCGANTTISDGEWHPGDTRAAKPSAITIGNDVWLGLGVTVLKGVEIGANTVVGAGSVVTHSLPGNVVAAGNPCRVIRSL